jgi:hypothetical protein
VVFLPQRFPKFPLNPRPGLGFAQRYHRWRAAPAAERSKRPGPSRLALSAVEQGQPAKSKYTPIRGLSLCPSACISGGPPTSQFNCRN